MGGKYPYIYVALLWESFPTTLVFVPTALNGFPDCQNTSVFQLFMKNKSHVLLTFKCCLFSYFYLT